MSEFQEKLQTMKDGMLDNAENNPALISSDLVDDEGNVQLPSEEYPDRQSAAIERNDKGHRKRKTLRDKLDMVLAENRAKDAQQQQLMSYIQEQERKLAEAQAKVDQSAHYSNVYYEQSLDNDEQRVITELEFAEESGDTKKKIELQRRLAEVAAQKQTLLLSKSLPKMQPQQENYPDINYYQGPQQPYQQEFVTQEPVNEVYEDWLEDHPWADERSPNYDPYLTNEANELATELNKRLKFNRQANVIGTPEYYSALSNIMQERYGTQNSNTDSDYDHTDYENNNIYEVAPVTKKGSSMADRYMASKQNYGRPTRSGSTMTPDQEVIARGMMPALSKVYNRPFTLEEAKAVYFEELKNESRR